MVLYTSGLIIYPMKYLVRALSFTYWTPDTIPSLSSIEHKIKEFDGIYSLLYWKINQTLDRDLFDRGN